MIDETFGERLARLCVEKGVPKNQIKVATGTALTNIDRSKTVSLKAAVGIAKALGMSLHELDAPILFQTTTRELIDHGIFTEEGGS